MSKRGKPLYFVWVNPDLARQESPLFAGALDRHDDRETVLFIGRRDLYDQFMATGGLMYGGGSVEASGEQLVDREPADGSEPA